ncbi:bicyclomycin/multidrug efflux system [Pelomyxa schiedti]|nr:bicyclomycin/multidrug efflux system [Pelomyxa schiedti]
MADITRQEPSDNKRTREHKHHHHHDRHRDHSRDLDVADQTRAGDVGVTSPQERSSPAVGVELGQLRGAEATQVKKRSDADPGAKDRSDVEIGVAESAAPDANDSSFVVDSKAPASEPGRNCTSEDGTSGGMTWRLWVLVADMVLMSVGAMVVEMCLIPALPKISTQFPENSEWVPWVISIYNIAGAVWTPIAGSLADFFGPKWITVLTLVLSMCGQVICALSSNSIFLLIVGRCIQGFGMAVSCCCLGLCACFDYCTDVLPRKACYTSDCCNDKYEQSESDTEAGVTPASTKKKQSSLLEKFWSFDPVGCILLICGVVLLLMSFTFSESWGWDEASTICLCVIGAVLLICLSFWELWVAQPLIPVRILLTRDQLLLSLVAIFSGFAQFSFFQILPYLYMSTEMSYKISVDDMLKVGLYMLPFGLASLFAMPLTIFIGKFLGHAMATSVAAAIAVLGTGLYIEFHDTVAQTIILNCVAGCGLGMSIIAVMNLITAISKPEQFGALSGANLLLRFVGGSLGPVVVTLILTHSAIITTDPDTGTEYKVYTDDSFTHSYIFLTCILACALVCTFGLSGMFKFFSAEGRKQLKAANQPQPSNSKP